MTRQALDCGSWFDTDTATMHDEATRWDGNNHISLATGSQWEHEALYRTRSGAWVLHAWSQWQGAGQSWDTIGTDAAAAWLVAQGHADVTLDRATAAAIAVAEL